MMRRLFSSALCALALVAAAVAGAARAQDAEEILSYDVVVEVEADGALEVAETIRVRVLGQSIKRGIYRDFPLATEEDDGRVSLATFEVLEVTRNGQPEPYTRSRSGAYAQARIGDADVWLPAPSEQTYLLRYRTEGQLRSFEGYDELYWNVTGDRWAFPIREASVEIRLPEGTPVLQHAAYTGPRGSTESEVRVLEAKDGVYRAETTAPLGPREGFTVAVAWPPGAVEVPPVEHAVAGLDGYARAPMTLGGVSLAPVAAVSGTVLATLLLFLLWTRVGRDPAAGSIYPRWDPPKGLGPAAIRFVKRQAFDARCMTAAILSMAVKGAVRITEREGHGLFASSAYTLTPLGASDRGLTPAEKAAYNKLFAGGNPLELVGDRKSGRRMDSARNALRSQLWVEHYGASFRKNVAHTALGVGAGGALTLVLLGIVTHWNGAYLLQWGIAAVVVVVVAIGILRFQNILSGGAGSLSMIGKSAPIFIFIAIAGVQVGVIAASGAIFDSLNPPVLLAGAAFGVAAAAFHVLMAAPSKAGRALMDQIEGFEMYMKTAEEDRLDMLNPPEKTPALFESLLPHAVALGLSHRWAEKFAGVLPAGAQPDWYDGHRRFDVDHMDRQFGSAVASTTRPSRSSGSGSGGGGSSGGGGGGGGGGGW